MDNVGAEDGEWFFQEDDVWEYAAACFLIDKGLVPPMPSDRPGNVTLAQWAKDYTTDFQFDDAFNLAVDMGDDDRKSMILRAHDMMSGIEESVAPTM